MDVSGVSTNFEGAKLVDEDMMRLVEDAGSCCSCLVMYAPRSSERVRLTFRSGVVISVNIKVSNIDLSSRLCGVFAYFRHVTFHELVRQHLVNGFR